MILAGGRLWFIKTCTPARRTDSPATDIAHAVIEAFKRLTAKNSRLIFDTDWPSAWRLWLATSGAHVIPVCSVGIKQIAQKRATEADFCTLQTKEPDLIVMRCIFPLALDAPLADFSPASPQVLQAFFHC